MPISRAVSVKCAAACDGRARLALAAVASKDYYEPICVAADLSSSTCRQQAAFERHIGASIEGDAVASAAGVTVPDCISLCFQNRKPCATSVHTTRRHRSLIDAQAQRQRWLRQNKLGRRCAFHSSACALHLHFCSPSNFLHHDTCSSPHTYMRYYLTTHLYFIASTALQAKLTCQNLRAHSYTQTRYD